MNWSNPHLPTVTLFPLHASATFSQHETLSRSTFRHDAGMPAAAGGARVRWGVPEGGYVSRRLLQLVMPVFPDRRIFLIPAPEGPPAPRGARPPPIGVLVSASREQLWVGSLQQDIDVRLVLE